MSEQGNRSDREQGAVAGEAKRTGRLLSVLGVAFGLAVLVGNTIGMGILRTPGEIAAHLPSAAAFLLVWVAGAVYALLGALCVSELGAMRPRSGGLYTFVHHALGGYPGFVSGWTDWIATCGSAAAVAMVIAEYLGPLVPALADWQTTVAAVLLVAFTLLHWRGVRMGDLAQQGTSLLKGIALVVLALVALVVSVPEAAGAPVAAAAPTLPAGMALAAAVVLSLQSAIYTYDGWTGPVYFGEEVRDPGRNLPRAMIGGVLIVLAIYLLLNAAFLRVVPIEQMAGDPFVAATAATRLFGPVGDTVLRVLMILSLVASLSALLMMGSRVPYALSRDRLFPQVLQRVNSGGTPVPALLAGLLLALAFIASNTFDTVVSLLAFFFVANYVLTFTSLFVLRIREPDAPRPFRVPRYPLVPGLALLGSLAFLAAAIYSDTKNSLLALGLVAVSWPVYWLLRKGHAGSK
ncbi:MAG: APC family permease [Xanthomonadales bacterium]|nr:APC family permease [Xanthomonadales bacterium]